MDRCTSTAMEVCFQTGKSVQVTDEQIDRHAAELVIERQLGQGIADRSLFGFEKIKC